MRSVRVLTVATLSVLALGGAVIVSAQPQGPQAPQVSCEQQLQQTGEYAMSIKNDRDQKEVNLAVMKRQITDLQTQVQELQKRAGLVHPPRAPEAAAPVAPPSAPAPKK